MSRRFTFAVYVNAILSGSLAVYFFLAPAFILLNALRDPGLKNGDIPGFAFKMHRSLSRNYENWARKRLSSGRALGLNSRDVAGTEWPIYSSVFYLWATEALQDAWDRDPKIASVAPAVDARGAIEAAAALISDPGQARWVKEYWGDDYLKSENMFYRMLLINGLTSYQKLTGDGKYHELLSSQVESMSAEMDRSPFGLLNDYPGQCYPVDILPVISAIRRADGVLGTDHSAFAARALRGFQGARLDPATGLPAYMADERSGNGFDAARGVGISNMLIWAPEVWPETAHEWYAAYAKQFWREKKGMAGFREYSAALPHREWLVDVDAGPVIAGFGTAASGFGIGAARVNGHFDHAYALAAEALVAAWPLPSGTLLGARMLSNASDAPFVGEAVILFCLTRRPVSAVNPVQAGALPPASACFGIAFYGVTGFLLVFANVLKVKRWTSQNRQKQSGGSWQFIVWIGLLAAAVIAYFYFNFVISLLCVLIAQFFPRPVAKNKVRVGTAAAVP